MQTWCNTSDQKTKPSLVTNAAFPRLLVMETGKKQKTVNTTNLRQPRRLLVLDLLETRPSSSPTDPHFHDSFLFYFPLFTQIVAFVYVACKQSVCQLTLLVLFEQ